ncbi:MAG: hypothetical protein AMJ81_02620 [Phycisphaerae bacterium SM23_33]|nr:MAG: hypothetical protein AMJ81_02620 [Phycisphaerae bacterium SM23_33]
MAIRGSRHGRLLWAAGLVAIWLAYAGSPGCGEGVQEAAKDEPKGWRETVIEMVSGITLAAEHGTLFYAYDTLAYPGQPVELMASVISLKEMEGVEGADVEFLLGQTSLGKVKTDSGGHARLNWTPPKPGDYGLTAKIVAVPEKDFEDMLKCAPTPLLVSARTKDTKFVVLDLDHTVVASSFFRVLFGGAKPMPESAEVVKELSKDYSVIYLTQRPGLLTVKSKNWLTGNGFPRAPLLVSEFKQAVGDSGKFKTGRLKALREQFPNVAIGIGDKISDAEAYVANGLKAYLIPHYDRQDDGDVRDMAEKVGKLNQDIQVVDDWEQIRAGILKARKYPPGTYAAGLKALAGKLEADKRKREEEKRRRKRREEEDDD